MLRSENGNTVAHNTFISWVEKADSGMVRLPGSDADTIDIESLRMSVELQQRKNLITRIQDMLVDFGVTDPMAKYDRDMKGILGDGFSLAGNMKINLEEQRVSPLGALALKGAA